MKPSTLNALDHIRHTTEYRQLNAPFKSRRYVTRENFPPLVDHRRKHAHLQFDEWVAAVLADTAALHGKDKDTNAGREWFIEFAHKIATDLQIEPQFALDALYIRVFLQTSQGFYAEQASISKAEEHFQERYPDTFKRIRHATDDEERNGSIDAVVEFTDGKLIGLQFKPSSYFTIAKNDGLRRDQIKGLEQNLYWLKTHRAFRDIYYINNDEVGRGNFKPLLLIETLPLLFGADNIPQHLADELLPF